MSNTALVLEGGGMRGIFTAGVLDLFIDKGLTFDNVTGVSAGAGHAVSYLSGQRGRAFDVCELYLANGEAVESAPHPSMIFWCRVPFEVNEGDIMRGAE